MWLVRHHGVHGAVSGAWAASHGRPVLRCASVAPLPSTAPTRRHFRASTPVARPRPRRKRAFVDRVRIQVEGGRGGRGVVSFEPLSNNKKRPVGGHGGLGGDVFLQSSQAVRHLGLQSFVFKGVDGSDASGKGNNGGRGRDKKVLVPCGTIVKEIVRTYEYDDNAELPEEYLESWAAEYEDSDDSDDDDDGEGDVWGAGASTDTNADSRSQFMATIPKALRRDMLRLTGKANFVDTITTIGELDDHGSQLTVARGGMPGYGNRHLASGQETPDTPHIVGSMGERRFLQLEMKAIADIGLVGFPNAGKSSLLRCVSRATPKVAPYPFTTLHPILGMLKYPDTFSLSIADIPGIIEGAHDNKGLGHEFLKHIERTQVLLYVVDTCSHTGVVRDLQTLQQELQLYNPDLPKRPSLVVANKMDLEGADEGLAALRASTLLPVIPVSALNRSNFELLASSIRFLVEQHARAQNSDFIVGHGAHKFAL